ncbi:hypothetical protein CSPX01_16991 [Colletotrichum filicis]|nr:hypothetical protein CSPX01_16991 [Colletotrichum filicis]
MLSKRLASGHPSTEPILGDWGAEARQSRRGTQVWRSAGAAVAPVGDRSYEPPPAETVGPHAFPRYARRSPTTLPSPPGRCDLAGAARLAANLF